jgi:MFS family permease
MVYLQLATYGYFLYAFTPSVTLLRDDEHTSRAISGLHGTGLAVGAILAGLAGPRIIERVGRARMIWFSMFLLCLGIGVFTSCRIVPVTIAGAVIAGFGGTVIVNLSAAILTAHHRGAAGGAAVTEANGFASSCGTFAPLLVSAAIALGVGWRGGVLVTVIFAAVIAIVFRNSGGAEHAASPAHLQLDRPGRMPRAFWRACGVLVLTTAVEFSMTIWSSDVLHVHDGLSKGTAATGVTAIVAGMSIGRLTAGRLALRLPLDRLLLGAFATTIVGFAIFWTFTNPVLAFAGLFVCGLGISLHFPLSITRAITFSEGRADAATGYVALATGMAIGVAPFALGALADHVGSHTALVAVPGFVIAAALAVGIGRPMRAGGDIESAAASAT